MLRAAVIVLFIALLPSHAWAEARVALLVGNEAYASEIGRLTNPHNDVALLEGALKGLGFEVVTVRDASLGALTRAVNVYARRLQEAGPNAIGFFYYSGHGASDGTANYLIPVDVKTTETGELWDESLRLTEITRRLKAEAGNATHLVVFDACRNTLKLTQPGSRAVVQSKGFVPIAQENGMLIAYATAEGELATDVGAGAGPYAKMLAEEIVKPGVEAVVMFRAVQLRVRAVIHQEPYVGFSALGNVYLAGKGEQPTAAPITQLKLSEAAEAWDRTKDTTSIAALEAFLARFKDTYYADLARLRLEELKQQVAMATPPAPPPKAKETARAAECPYFDAFHPRLYVHIARDNEGRCLTLGKGQTEWFKDCDRCPEMVVVPAGDFTMGSPASEHERSSGEAQLRVSIGYPFAVARFAATFDEWDACVADGGCNSYIPDDQGWGRGKHPVINVNWNDAKAYTTWLSRKTGKTYRLLSEAEREYVTRAGTITPFWWGSSITPKQANYNGSEYPYEGGGSTGEYRKRTVPVDSFEPNPWGLYQVHGNVWDWTEDCWNESNAGNPGDGTARTSGNCTIRVVRGGSWYKYPEKLRSAGRSSDSTGYRNYSNGFRLARTLNP
jgi:formylglycine-generating enzyme required for sulfatase activity